MDSFKLLVRAGLMSESEAEAAANRQSPQNKKVSQGPDRRIESAPSDTKPSES